MHNHNYLTIHEAHQLLVDKQISSVELTRRYLKKIRQLEPKIGAFITITEEQALKQAEEADRQINQGNAKPLTGIPMLIKDNICTKGIRTTCASKMLDEFIPPYNATVANKLFKQGAVLVGKANMDEFAMGSSTENSAYFVTHNPWDLDRVPGGSSGGSAAAVAAGEVIFALGSDTGGSIRQPAGFCNVTGMKPTYGSVSRYGLIAFASSLDQIGPLTQDVLDCALVLNTITGYDPQDSTSVPYSYPDYTRCLTKDIRGLRIGVPGEYFIEGIQPEIESSIQDALNILKELGVNIDRKVTLPHTKYALAVYYIIAPSEASANLARYDGVKYGFSDQSSENMWEAMDRTRQKGFGAEVKRRIMLGTHALSSGYYDAYYLKAQKVRTLIRQEFDEAFRTLDALIVPTSPTVPFRIGEKVDDPLQMYLSDIFTIPVNIAGLPAITIPVGFADDLPIGIQIIGKPFGEEVILKLAYAFEQATTWHLRRPTI